MDRAASQRWGEGSRDSEIPPTPMAEWSDLIGAASTGTTREEQISKGRNVIIRQLTSRARTRAHLEGVLTARGIAADVRAELLDRFEELGLVNDEEFADAWVRSRSRQRGLAASVLKRELLTKGVSEEIAQQTVAGLDPDDERDRARALVEKRARQLAGLDREVQSRRLMGMLARKGYSGSVSSSVIREYFDSVER